MSLTEAIRSLPKGKLKAPPIIVPIIAIAIYFTRYMPLILPFLIPIAFITPISLKSSVTERLITNLKTTKATMIRATDRISTIKAIRSDII